MIKLKIKSVNNSQYTLIDEDSNEYNFILEFHDIKKNPGVNDYILMSKELLDKNYEEYSNFYAFGSLNDQAGRKINSKNEKDLIAINLNNDTIYLKRFFG